MTFIKGLESGDYLAPSGLNFYKSLLKDSYLQESEEIEPDSSINTFSIAYKEEFFESSPTINIIFDQKSLKGIKKEIFLTVIAKENISRQCEIIFEKPLLINESKTLKITLRESQFRKFTFNNSIHIDVIVYSKEKT